VRETPFGYTTAGPARGPRIAVFPSTRPVATVVAMRLLAWNIRHGGGRRLPSIFDALAVHAPDVVVLCEYRQSTGPLLRAALKQMGYSFATDIEPPRGRNGVLIAARHPLRAARVLSHHVEEPYRLVHTELPCGLQLVGVYMPNLLRKVPYWDAVLRAARRRRGGPAIFVGDFNTTRHFLDEAGAVCLTSQYMDDIERAGFRDAWRDRNPAAREFSWYSHRGNGFRLDHAFCSAPLASRLRAIRYSHDERLRGVSDHSAIVMDFMPNGAGQHRKLRSPGEPACPRAVDLPVAFSVPARPTSL
jgi:exonuclease III